MKNSLFSLTLRHDHSLKSLTKQALADIILKLIYFAQEKGISIRRLRKDIELATGVKFAESDIHQSIKWLMKTENKVYQKNDKFLIKEQCRIAINKIVAQREKYHQNVTSNWFSKSETYYQSNGPRIVADWFQEVLIDFFKDYSYDWIRDLRPKRKGGKRIIPDIERVINKSFKNHDIVSQDYEWLKKRFIEFLHSERPIDNELLWDYGSSRFSATLLTARSYADDFSLESFRDSYCILDTNILMILGLEGFDKSEAIEHIESFMGDYNITPFYFQISKEEYQRAILPKKEITLKTLEKFSLQVIKDFDCPFVRTAINRECQTLEDFERFFDGIIDVPDVFYDTLELVKIDMPELDIEITNGGKSTFLLNGINNIHRRRTGKDKRENPKVHDAGLYNGAKYLRSTQKTFILTRDSVLREFAYEDAVRDDYPLAIGIDSLIHMLALHAGGTDRSSNDFMPLFSKLVKASLFPDKSVFQQKDFEYLLKAHVDISALDPEQVKDLARKVNRLRYRCLDETDIDLEIRRTVQDLTTTDLENELIEERSKTQRAIQAGERKDQSIESLKDGLISKSFTEKILKEKIRVAKTAAVFFIYCCVLAIGTWFLLNYMDSSNNWVVLTCGFISNLIFDIAIFRIFNMGQKLRINKEAAHKDAVTDAENLLIG